MPVFIDWNHKGAITQKTIHSLPYAGLPEASDKQQRERSTQGADLFSPLICRTSQASTILCSVYWCHVTTFNFFWTVFLSHSDLLHIYENLLLSNVYQKWLNTVKYYLSRLWALIWANRLTFLYIVKSLGLHLGAVDTRYVLICQSNISISADISHGDHHGRS